MIVIKKSECADTRTCDWSKVTKRQLLENSKLHISDVQAAGDYFLRLIRSRFNRHDHTKVSHIDDFHKDFSCGFKTQDWYAMHKAIERHHLEAEDGIREDVNLIDVLEYVADCVMAGMARSGEIRELTVRPEVLSRAAQNTAEMLKEVILVEENHDQ